MGRESWKGRHYLTRYNKTKLNLDENIEVTLEIDTTYLLQQSFYSVLIILMLILY